MYCHPTPEPLEPRRLLAGGDLDLSFGQQGTVRERIGPYRIDIGDAAIEPRGGGILIAGTVSETSSDPPKPLLLRYNFDGSRDNSFPATSFVAGNPSNLAQIDHLVMLPDGRFIV